ncbi:hypothetical protein [Paramicrobacterium chengjingii]|uniref:Uncharacterized protein n=1 Tax=Paramicrobacterium chengjingii TaxID=2769067 RepID=A0ABX6YHH2_9MICO|nr:hypothetical protein [Microbacterium chengjingii]QPZ38259.1 hypothetical protein HCR76_15955 [Microbacterium chengjingii]
MFLVFGVAAPDDTFARTPREVYDKELTIVGSIIIPYTHERAVAMLQALPLDSIPERTFSLSDYESAFAAQCEGREKIYLTPNPEPLKVQARQGARDFVI